MFESITNFFSVKTKLWKIIILFSAFLFLAISLFFIWQAFRPHQGIKNPAIVAQNKQSPARQAVRPAQCPDCVRRALDGVYVRPEAANPPPVAVMIDNHPDARPPSGIEKANLVYEAEVEGYSTRLMAVFADGNEVAKIGPVRSARPYFVDWANELNAVYAHCGGSPEALVDIEQKGIVDLNEFYNGKFFWRATGRPAPHNIYLSSKNFNKFLEDKNISQGDFSSWSYKEDSPLNNSSSSGEILINYSDPEFKVKWVYDKTDNDYLRYNAEKPELTADNNLIVAKNIVIQTVPVSVIDAVLRLKMYDIGSGTALICLDGACQPGLWAKPDSAIRTKFSYQNGEEVKFNAGTTWIEVVRPEIKIEY
jgi:hypothetical protein